MKIWELHFYNRKQLLKYMTYEVGDRVKVFGNIEEARLVSHTKLAAARGNVASGGDNT